MTCLQGSSRDADIENRLKDTKWERKERWLNGESSMQMLYALPYVKQRANGKLLYETGNSNQECNNLEGWQGVGGGRGVQEGGAYVHLCKIEKQLFFS